ncbi:TPA: hypothetical protein ACOF2E_002478 [Staphylococcus aureus]
MSHKLDINKQMSKEEIYLIKLIEKDKNKALKLPLLLITLMTIELFIDIVLKTNVFILIIVTYCFSLIINTYVFYKLNLAKERLSLVFTANHNNITINKLLDLNKNETKKLIPVGVSWKNFRLEYLMLVINAFLCINIVFVSYINNFVV